MDSDNDEFEGSLLVRWPPPDRWQDFELLTLDLCRIRWNDPDAYLHGRGGQAQDGVDVFGTDLSSGTSVGVQCKQRKIKAFPNELLAGNSIKTSDIVDALKEIVSFDPPLDNFVYATTAETDKHIQEHVRKHNASKAKPKLAVWFWDDYNRLLNRNRNLLLRYYANPYHALLTFSPEEHYLRMLAMAFNRPAMTTEFWAENTVAEFAEAISILQRAVATGQLDDHRGRNVDYARPPATLTQSMTTIQAVLTTIRNEVTLARREGALEQGQGFLVIRDRRIIDRMNHLRRDILVSLNHLLVEHSIDKLPLSY